MTFEQVPAALDKIQATLSTLQTKIEEMSKAQPVNEPPIQPRLLRERLGISEPTEIKMRKRGELPCLEVGGKYMYLWLEVVAALSKKKTSKISK